MTRTLPRDQIRPHEPVVLTGGHPAPDTFRFIRPRAAGEGDHPKGGGGSFLRVRYLRREIPLWPKPLPRPAAQGGPFPRFAWQDGFLFSSFSGRGSRGYDATSWFPVRGDGARRCLRPQPRVAAGGALDGVGEIFRRLRAGDDDAAAEDEAGHAVDAGFLGARWLRSRCGRRRRRWRAAGAPGRRPCRNRRRPGSASSGSVRSAPSEK